MGKSVEGTVSALFDLLRDVPLENEDRALITQVVLNRLGDRYAGKPAEPPSMNKLARDIYKVSHERNAAFGTDCCPDPEWNMLLDLVVAHTEGRPVYVSSLCVASGVPPTTALRHVERMASTGLLQRRECKKDRRRVWVELTPHALATTERLLRKVYDAG